MRWLGVALCNLLSLVLAQSSAQLPLGSFTSPPPPTHPISSLVRSLEVGGAITRESTAVQFRGDAGAGDWYMPIEEDRHKTVSFVEVVEGKGKSVGKKLAVQSAGYDGAGGVHYYKVAVPSGSSAITVSLHYTHLTSPLPRRLAQKEGDQQGMLWKGDLLGGLGALSGALADDAEVTVKVKIPTPRVFSHNAPAAFTSIQTSGSSSVVFTNRGIPLEGSQIGSVHYSQPYPVMAISNLTRLVEVSHWGGNVAVEDKIELENVGPALKGTFSRLDHQTGTYTRKPGWTAHTLTALSMALPAGTTDPYYVDVIGNVSTSRFRPAPSSGQSKLKRMTTALLELVPRYPIVGGWRYSFTVGFNVPASGTIKVNAQTGEYILGVPMFTPIKDIAVDDVTLRVRLPEGAKDIKVTTPFPVDELQDDLIDKTYLDTTGRPTVLLHKRRCTERHGNSVYISYTHSSLSMLQKPIAVAAWMVGLFFVGGLLRRFQWRIGR